MCTVYRTLQDSEIPLESRNQWFFVNDQSEGSKKQHSTEYVLNRQGTENQSYYFVAASIKTMKLLVVVVIP